jgi:hypothetical protein
MDWASFWAPFSQTRLVTLWLTCILRIEFVNVELIIFVDFRQFSANNIAVYLESVCYDQYFCLTFYIKYHYFDWKRHFFAKYFFGGNILKIITSTSDPCRVIRSDEFSPNFCINLGKGWVILMAIFSQTHIVTLDPCCPLMVEAFKSLNFKNKKTLDRFSQWGKQTFTELSECVNSASLGVGSFDSMGWRAFCRILIISSFFSNRAKKWKLWPLLQMGLTSCRRDALDSFSQFLQIIALHHRPATTRVARFFHFIFSSQKSRFG